MTSRRLRPLRRRHDQRGQILIAVALMSVVIFGAVALGVDIGHQTVTRRNLQNISDAASLAAARDVYVPADGSILPAGGVQQTLAANDAASSLALNQGWPTGWITTPPANTCPATGYCFTATYAGETVAFSTPPANPVNPADNTTAYAEVDLSSTVNNGFANLIGQPQSVIRSKSVGVHSNANTQFGYALFSATNVETGNSPEIILGNVYMGANFSPQSSGQSYLCAEPLPGNVAEPGYVVFGAPQPTPPTVIYSSTCATGAGNITSEAPQGVCPAGVSWVPPPAGGGYGFCMASPALAAPIVTPPTTTGPLQTCTVTSQPAPQANGTVGGVYRVTSAQCPSGLAINFSQSFQTLTCTSFLLDYDVVVSIYLSKKNLVGNMSSYGSSACAGAGITPDQAAFFQAATPAPLGTCDPKYSNAVLCMTGNGCCPPLTITGSIYMPGATASLSTNSALYVTGQGVVSDWVDQSGLHPNANITFNGSDAPNLGEQLRLVE
jgi:Flp pilus assembly protein TadG